MPTRTYHLIPHTHWDREWYLTRAEFVCRLVPALDDLVARLEADAAFRAFALDGQTVLLEDYLAVRPEMAARVRALVAAGRLQVGPWYVLADEQIPSGESLIRNLLAGSRDADRPRGQARRALLAGRVRPSGDLAGFGGRVRHLRRRALAGSRWRAGTGRGPVPLARARWPRDPGASSLARRVRGRRIAPCRCRSARRSLAAAQTAARSPRPHPACRGVRRRRPPRRPRRDRPRPRRARRARARRGRPRLLGSAEYLAAAAAARRLRATPRRRAAVVVRLHLDAPGRPRDPRAAQAPARGSRARARADRGATRRAGAAGGAVTTPGRCSAMHGARSSARSSTTRSAAAPRTPWPSG